jgi:hypothetical protein
VVKLEKIPDSARAQVEDPRGLYEPELWACLGAKAGARIVQAYRAYVERGPEGKVIKGVALVAVLPGAQFLGGVLFGGYPFSVEPLEAPQTGARCWVRWHKRVLARTGRMLGA